MHGDAHAAKVAHLYYHALSILLPAGGRTSIWPGWDNQWILLYQTRRRQMGTHLDLLRAYLFLHSGLAVDI